MPEAISSFDTDILIEEESSYTDNFKYTGISYRLEVSNPNLPTGAAGKSGLTYANTGASNPAWAIIANASASNGSYVSSAQNNDYLDFTFYGTGFTVYVTKGTDCGIAEISIDSVVITTADTYAAAPVYQSNVYSNLVLTMGTHTGRIRVTNTKNVSSSAYKINIDCIDIVGSTQKSIDNSYNLQRDLEIQISPIERTYYSNSLGKTAGSVTNNKHIIYQAVSNALLVPTSGTWAELIQANYDALSFVNATSYQKTTSVNTEIAQILLKIDLSHIAGGSNTLIENYIREMSRSVWASGSGTTGNSLNMAIWDFTNSSYCHLITNTAATPTLTTITLTSSLSDHIGSSNESYILLYTYSSNGVIASQITLDYWSGYIKHCYAKLNSLTNTSTDKYPKGTTPVISYSRGSIRYNSETGVLIATGLPCWNPGMFNRYKLRIGGGTTNIFLNPTMATVTSWVVTSSGTLAAEAVSPGGCFPFSATACLSGTIAAGQTACVIFQVVTLSLSTTYTITFWCYVPSATTGTCWVVAFDNAYTALGYTSITERDQWVKKTLTFVSSGSNTTHRLGSGVIGGGTPGNKSYACMCQLEQKAYATGIHPVAGGSRSNETVTISTSLITPTQFSISQWVYVDEAAKRQVAGQYPTIISIMQDYNAVFFLYHQSSTAAWNFYIRNDASTPSFPPSEVSDSYTPNGWNLFTTTIDFISKVVKLYINSTLRSTLSSASLFTKFNYIYIGSYSGNNHFIDTDFGEFFVENRVIPDADILAYYNSNKPYVTNEYTSAYFSMNNTLNSDIIYYAKPAISWSTPIELGYYDSVLIDGHTITKNGVAATSQINMPFGLNENQTDIFIPTIDSSTSAIVSYDFIYDKPDGNTTVQGFAEGFTTGKEQTTRKRKIGLDVGCKDYVTIDEDYNFSIDQLWSEDNWFDDDSGRYRIKYSTDPTVTGIEQQTYYLSGCVFKNHNLSSPDAGLNKESVSGTACRRFSV